MMEACPELTDHIHNTILSPTHKMFNPVHLHLNELDLGFLFTNIENSTKGQRILGQAKIPGSGGDAWGVGMTNLFLIERFGYFPDALIILNGIWFSGATNLQRYALIEHELFHIAQKTDQYGLPQWDDETGKPKIKIQGHDVEEFIGVVSRYGTYSPELAQMKGAMMKEPEFTIGEIDGICGSCKRKVA